MNILVTGAKGYVGAKLEREVNLLNHNVYSIDLKEGKDLVSYNFNKKIDRRFERLEDDYDSLYDSMTKEYVLKEDFRREIESVHTKLDRILDHLLSN